MRKFTVMIIALFTLLLVACSNESDSNVDKGSDTSDASEGTETNEQKQELSFGHVLTEDSTYQVAAETMQSIFGEEGNFELEIFSHSQLGSEAIMAESLIEGDLTFQFAGLSNLENLIPELKIMNIPYVFDNTEQMLNVLDTEDVNSMIAEKLEEKGIVGLGWLGAERNIFTTNQPINSLDDLHSLKIRVLQSPSYIKAYEALGAQPTAIDYGELYIATQQGVVDGGDVVPEQFISDKFYETSEYYNFTRIHQMPLILIMSKKVYDELDDTDKDLVQQAAEAGIIAAREAYLNNLEASMEEIEELGVEIVEPDLAEFKDAVKSVGEELMEEIPNAEEWINAINSAK